MLPSRITLSSDLPSSVQPFIPKMRFSPDAGFSRPPLGASTDALKVRLPSAAWLTTAAATVIANAVDVAHPAIRRLPASECKDGSDLGDTPVTVDVPDLPAQVVADALDAGARRARQVQAAGHAWAAILVCQGQWRLVQPLSSASGQVAQPALGSVFA